MDDLDQTCASLRAQIAATESELARLKRDLHSAEQGAASATNGETRNNATGKRNWPLLPEEYRRYGRQMIVPQLGLQGELDCRMFAGLAADRFATGQLRLRSSKVLIVGAGGLGCPSGLYLAGAGVGTLGMVDGDTVESSNLHRQVLHRTRNVGKFKVDSAIEYLRE